MNHRHFNRQIMRQPDAELRQIKQGRLYNGSGQAGQGRGAPLIEAYAETGYRPLPPADTILNNQQVMQRAEMGRLLRERTALEGTNVVSQSHPLQDSPFLAIDIHFSSSITTVSPSTQDNTFTIISALEPRFVAMIRTLEIVTFDASADDDLTVRVLVNGAVQQGDQGVRPDALISFRQNAYYRIMENQSCRILVDNSSTVMAHDIQVRAYGWKYPVGAVVETARGIMPNVT